MTARIQELFETCDAAKVDDTLAEARSAAASQCEGFQDGISHSRLSFFMPNKSPRHCWKAGKYTINILDRIFLHPFGSLRPDEVVFSRTLCLMIFAVFVCLEVPAVIFGAQSLSIAYLQYGFDPPLSVALSVVVVFVLVIVYVPAYFAAYIVARTQLYKWVAYLWVTSLVTTAYVAISIVLIARTSAGDWYGMNSAFQVGIITFCLGAVISQAFLERWMFYSAILIVVIEMILLMALAFFLTPSDKKFDSNFMYAIAFSASIVTAVIISYTHHKYRKEMLLARSKEIHELQETRMQAQKNFVSNVSHDLRTPLNGICGSLELITLELKDKQGDILPSVGSELFELTKTASASATFLLSLVNDILDYGVLESGSLQIHAEEFELHEILVSSMNLVAMNANEKRLALLLFPRESLRRVVVGDSIRVKQIFSNVIGNAIKFTAQGYVAVSSWYDDHKEILTVHCRDTGIGVDSNVTEKIFDRFAQAHGRDIISTTGTGLGLSICRMLCTLMDGDISLHSAKDAMGSLVVFTLRLPLVTIRRPSVAESSYTLSQTMSFDSSNEGDCRPSVMTTSLQNSLSIASLRAGRSHSKKRGSHSSTISSNSKSSAAPIAVIGLFVADAYLRQEWIDTLQNPSLDGGYIACQVLENLEITPEVSTTCTHLIIDISVSGKNNQEVQDALLHQAETLFHALCEDETGAELKTVYIFHPTNYSSHKTSCQCPKEHELLYRRCPCDVSAIRHQIIAGKRMRVRSLYSLQPEIGLVEELEQTDALSAALVVEVTDLFGPVEEDEEDDEEAEPPAKVIRQVLVAEDHPINRALLGRMLKTLGLDFVAVNNGKEAVEAIADSPNVFDCILMDVHMPVMNGYDASKRIREMEAANDTYGHISIVACAASSFSEDKKLCFEAGMDGFMTKPIRIEKLHTLLEDLPHRKPNETA